MRRGGGGGGAGCLCVCVRLSLQMYASAELVHSVHSTPCTIISFVIGFHSPHWQQGDAGRAGQRTVTQLQHELTNTRGTVQTGGSRIERHGDANGRCV